MFRVYLIAASILLVGTSLLGERVLSRERSFIAPSLVVRKELKREDIPQVKIPTPSPKSISLDEAEYSGKNIIVARPIDLVYIQASDRKYSGNSYYSIGGGPFLLALGAIHLPKPGSYQITYYAIDLFGNRDSGRTKLLLVDAEPPKVQLRFSEELSVKEERHICMPSVPLLITANDQLSGVKSIFWKTSTEEIWKRYEKPISVDLEKDALFFTVQSYAIDHAGNVSQVDTISCYSASAIGTSSL